MLKSVYRKHRHDLEGGRSECQKVLIWGVDAGEIARYAIKYALISPQGKTPEATMASALYTDIKKKEGASIFIRPHEGLFGLREWLAKDMNFEVGQVSATWRTSKRLLQCCVGKSF